MNPIRNQILFKPLPTEEKTDAGLFIPENARMISNKGIVVKVGNGTAKQPMKLKEGTVGYRVKDWGEPILIDGEIHFLMDEKAIIAAE